jgi:hypothetical protein
MFLGAGRFAVTSFCQQAFAFHIAGFFSCRKLANQLAVGEKYRQINLVS